MNILGNIGFVSSLEDFGPDSGLNGASGIASARINGRDYLFVAAQNENRLQALSVSASGVLATTYIVERTNQNGLGQVLNVETITIGGNLFLVTTSINDYAVSVFRVDTSNSGTDSQMTHTSTIFNGVNPGQSPISYPGDLATVTVGGNAFVVVAGYFSDSVVVMRISSDGILEETDAILDGDLPGLVIDGALSIETRQIGSKTFVFVASGLANNGISVFELSSAGTLTNVENEIVTGNNYFFSMTSTSIGGIDYLFAADHDDNAILTYQIASNGALTLVDTYSNALAGFDFVGLQIYEVDGVKFLLATEADLDRLVVFSFTAEQGLARVRVFNSAANLDGAARVIPLRIGEREFLAVTAVNGDNVTILEVGALNEALVGSAQADQMVGQNGDDDIIGLAGDDIIFGGLGFDVLSGRAGADTLYGGDQADVLVGGKGDDILVGGDDADVLIGNVGADTASYIGSDAAVTVNLATRTASGGDAAGDTILEIENVTGSSFADTLTGNGVINVLSGGGGNDTLRSGAGRDVLNGDAGEDDLFGDTGDDTLNGGSENDDLFGGEGNDLMAGGDGNDVLSGDAGNDTLNGQNGADRLDGGAGDDTMNGGAGADVFVFQAGFGNDTINGFSIAEDRLDFSGLAAIGSLAQFQAAAITFSGNTVVSVDDFSILIVGVTESQFTNANFIF